MTSPALAKTENDPATPDRLFEYLKTLGIDYTLYHHEAVFTVAESEKIEQDITGIHCRNLFLRDDKKRNWFLVVAANETTVRLDRLSELLGVKRLSFGSPESLWDMLGIRPGSVCPFAVINDRDRRVQVILDSHMMSGDIVNYHPLVNTMTIGVKPGDLIRFLESAGHDPRLQDFREMA